MEAQLQRTDDLDAARKHAQDFQLSLEPKKKKRLGQFFTGLPLSRLVAALSVSHECRTIIDPMSGHGDLLDAAVERSSAIGAKLQRVDAIEVDPPTAAACELRLSPWAESEESSRFTVIPSSAFSPEVQNQLESEGYDLVITNPPYVRYQSFAGTEVGDRQAASAEIRESLLRIVEGRTLATERPVWRALVEKYSGLADLSVPSWLLAAMLVKPGGTLAVVAPATWRNRNYGQVLRYLLAKCFHVEAVIADCQPGWFSEALVRTHVVIAHRLSTDETLTPLRRRPNPSRPIIWAEVNASSSGNGSLVGRAFSGKDPDGSFAEWLRSRSYVRKTREKSGISVIEMSHSSEAGITLFECRKAAWAKALESDFGDLPLFCDRSGIAHDLIPAVVKAELIGHEPTGLRDLEAAGVSVSQGLRTGCNGFFYVKLIADSGNGKSRVCSSALLGSREFDVPTDALRPVLQRQSDLAVLAQGTLPTTRLLDLRHYILPEDMAIVKASADIYSRKGEIVPTVMSGHLADFVKTAAETRYDETKIAKLIPELSAVATNVRTARATSREQTPRFWYMIPDLMPRHTPAAFVARVNQNAPWTIANSDARLVIDANFSTLFDNDGAWTGPAIAALLNSVWCQACMEALATPMGGGALKLEATHLKRLPVPSLTAVCITHLHRLGSKLNVDQPSPDHIRSQIDDIVVGAACSGMPASARGAIIKNLRALVRALSQARQGSSSA